MGTPRQYVAKSRRQGAWGGLVATMRDTELYQRAWAMVENLRALWSCPDGETGPSHLRNWLTWAKQRALSPIKILARTVTAHSQGILNYLHHRTTCAACEGLDNIIATLCKRASGYRNLDNLRTVILFHLGHLDLYPDNLVNH